MEGTVEPIRWIALRVLSRLFRSWWQQHGQQGLSYETETYAKEAEIGLLGATHYTWRRDIDALVHKLLNRYPRLTANTYIDHPWPDWDYVSVDVWGPGGRGDAIPDDLVRPSLHLLQAGPALTPIRHYIHHHILWTSFGGRSVWVPNDHSGRRRHLHVTWWR